VITVQEQDPRDADPRLGTKLGTYIVVARVADGAMGRVYEGRDPDTKARVAVKVLHAHVARDNVAVSRFKREYESANEMSHSHVVKVHEFGNTPEGSRFLTMEYLEGEELGKLLARGEPVTASRILRITSQIALALEYAHSFGFIHRDLKPDNIFLCKTEDGDDVRILDFGSVKLQMEMGAKLTAFGTTVGSPYYMSPEQAMGKADVDQRTDVFALGAIVYEMLTGKVAFEAPSLARILVRIMQEEPTPPSRVAKGAPMAMDDVIVSALCKDKQQRYAGARELASAVIAAYGLSGTVEHFSTAKDADIVGELAQAEATRANVQAKVPATKAESARKAEDAAKTAPEVIAQRPAAGVTPAEAVTTAPLGSMVEPLAATDPVQHKAPLPSGLQEAASTGASGARAGAPRTSTTRASSLPPLPRTGLTGKNLALVAGALLVACIVIALLMR
jgi:serine/threonine-protein kinase